MLSFQQKKIQNSQSFEWKLSNLEEYVLRTFVSCESLKSFELKRLDLKKLVLNILSWKLSQKPHEFPKKLWKKAFKLIKFVLWTLVFQKFFLMKHAVQF